MRFHQLKAAQSIDDINIKQPVFIDDFLKQISVGEGSFGKVYKVIDKKSNKMYAAKKTFDTIDEIESIDLTTEISIMSQLNHPAIVKFKGYSFNDFKKKHQPVIFSEFVKNGTLKDLIIASRQNPNKYIITDTQKLIIIYGIASALSYLHKYNIIHRDLKPENILMNDFLLPKVSDFGLSMSITNPRTDVKAKQEGTPRYMAPEIFRECQYSKSSDVYSFSLIVYELMTGQIPFENDNRYSLMIKHINHYRPEFNTPIPDSYRKLITSCWAEDPSERPTFDEIVELLRTDRGFITENVDENEFMIYVNYIEKYNKTFNPVNDEDFNNIVKQFERIKNEDSFNLKKYQCFSMICPLKDFNELNSKCRKLVLEAENDPSKQFLIGIYFIEGQELFPKNTYIGIKYLKKSMKSGVFESAIYYCEILIKGKDIPCNLQKAKKISEKMIKNVNLGVYFRLWFNKQKREKIQRKFRIL